MPAKRTRRVRPLSSTEKGVRAMRAKEAAAKRARMKRLKDINPSMHKALTTLAKKNKRRKKR